MAIPTENEGTGERGERRERRTGAAARQSAFLRKRIGFAVFSAGSPLGAARPQTCAKEPLALWTLFIWVVMWARFTRRRGLGDNEDLTGLRSFCANTFLSKCLAFGSRLLFAACAPNRTACDMFRSYSRVGRDRHSHVLGSSIWLSNFVSSLRDCAFLSGDPDGERRGRGERSRQRGVSALLRDRIGFAVFSAGSPLGLRAPNLRQRVFDSLDSLHLGRDVGAFHAGRVTRG